MPIKEVHFSQIAVTWWHIWFSHCVTNHKVMGSTTDGGHWIFLLS